MLIYDAVKSDVTVISTAGAYQGIVSSRQSNMRVSSFGREPLFLVSVYDGLLFLDYFPNYII